MSKSEEEWRAVLTPEQFRVIREKGNISTWRSFFVLNLFGIGTEPAGTGKYNKFNGKGNKETRDKKRCS
jgi:peptide-methionine (R)-S-oxide reductase